MGSTALVSSGRARAIVVLGYSDAGRDKLHPVCARRLQHAAKISTARDVVVFSGWARVPGTRPEAELMAEAWTGSAGEIVVDPDARTTVENATNALNDVTRAGVVEVVVVTSRWHAPRAAAAFAWRLRDTGARVVTSTPWEEHNLRGWLRELPRWVVLPLQLATARPAAIRRPN